MLMICGLFLKGRVLAQDGVGREDLDFMHGWTVFFWCDPQKRRSAESDGGEILAAGRRRSERRDSGQSRRDSGRMT